MSKTADYILTEAGRTADIMKQGFAKQVVKKPHRKKADGFDPARGKYGWLGADFFKKGW